MSCLVFIFFICLSLIVQSGYGPEKVINFSGYYPVDNGGRNLFYWFFESRDDPLNSPLIFWITSGIQGPGCSSMISLLTENGPYKINNNTQAYLNEYSWNTNANIIYIDQPGDVGYSYVNDYDYVLYEKAISNDLYHFIQLFMLDNPKYAKLDFWVAGDSYGGHYIPSFSRLIIDENNNSSNIFINLQGLLIGDGLVDPYNQYQSYPIYAKMNNLVTNEVYNIMQDCLPFCLKNIELCNSRNSSVLEWPECVFAWELCTECYSIPIVWFKDLNPYDITKNCTFIEKPHCYNYGYEYAWLNENTTKEGLNVDNNVTWNECSIYVDGELILAGNWMKAFYDDITTILDNGKQVLGYFGENNYLLNWIGGYLWMKNLNWAYNNEWNNAVNQTWTVNGDSVGMYKTYANLTFLKVYDVGLMVSMDKPEIGLRMVNQMINEGGFK